MEPIEPAIGSFRFDDPEQESIHGKLLRLVGPGPAAFYKDACWLMTRPLPVESTTHLVSHLLREIESALRDVLEPIVEHGEPLEDNEDESARHKAEILAIIRYLSIPESDPIAQAWLRLAKRGTTYPLHARAHRRDLLEPRPLDQEFVRLWEDTQTILKIILDKFEAHYASVFDTLDDILAKSEPSRADLKLLRGHVPDNIATWSYFFGKLSSAPWLMPLKDAGFFDHPPEPKFDVKKKAIRLAAWPQSQYLARVASISPSQVLEIIRDIPKTENLFVHSDLVDAALAMPQELAAKWAEVEASWLEARESIDFLLPQKLGELVGHLAKGKQVDAALSLAKSLLGTLPSKDVEEHVFPSEPHARFDTWDYEQILQTQVPSLVAVAGERALVMLCDLLESAAQLYLKSPGTRDYSHQWRPAVEDSDQNHLSDPKRLLVSAVRDAAAQIIKVEPPRLLAVVEELEKRKGFIFRRIALYILNSFPTGNDALIAERLTDQVSFDHLDLWHEYSILAQNHFGNLSRDDKCKILKWIGEGPDVEDFISKKERQEGKAPTKAETELYVKQWQLSHLARIRAALPEEWKSCYSELTKELGEPEHPEYLVYSGGGFGPTSPKKAHELRSLSVADIVRFLKEWRPSGGILEPSPEGLGRELATVVSSDPARFASDTSPFRDLDPTYVRAVLSGFTEAVEKKLPFEWASVLELCQWVVKQPRVTEEQERYSLDFDIGWTSARKTIARLLSKGFGTGAGEIPYELRNKAWEVIDPMTEDPDPTAESERINYDPPNLDPANLAINTVRGEAIHAVTRYALWVRRHGEKDSGKPVGFEAMPEARVVLEAHLDPTIEKALAIRAIYGQLLPLLFYLDGKWASAKLSEIFPHDDTLLAFRDVAWETYVVFSHVYVNLFKELCEEYAAAVERLDEPQKWHHVDDPKGRLAEHLMVLYWHGELGLTHGIFVRFYEKASDMLLGHAMGFIGRSLLNTEEKDLDEVLDRLRNLWDHRLSESQLLASSAPHTAELAAFGWWFASGEFNDDWALAKLSTVLAKVDRVEAEDRVLRRLSGLVADHPEIVIECLSLMIKDDKGPLVFLVRHDQVRSILTGAINSGNSNAAGRAKDLVNRLVALGYHEFRNLVGREI